MGKKAISSRRIFNICNIILLIIIAATCLLPFIHILALSLSENSAVMAGEVKLWPVKFTIKPYDYLLKRALFWNAFLISIQRVVIGSTINIFLTVLLAYPLSKENNKFHSRTVYVWFFFITMLISGGLVPTYMLVARLDMLDTLWSLVIPGAVQVFYIILMLNFFRQIPKELEEAAFMDGAGHFRTLFQIYIPLSLSSIATITLFSMVGHWNAWFDGIIYMNRPDNYPLQSYLRGVVINLDMSNINSSSWTDFKELSDRTIKCSQIIIATIPILMVYPFLQRYFVKGIVLGSVKG